LAALAPNIGLNQETDSAFRIRRQCSVSLSAQGVNNSLRAALLNIPNITYAEVYENDTGAPADIYGNPISSGDPNAIPRNSIWVVVSGATDAGTQALIAAAIYNKRNTGCGMKGNVKIPITQADGTTFYVYFDYITVERGWISFTAKRKLTAPAGYVPDPVFLAAQLALNYAPAIAASLNSSDLTVAVAAIDPNCDVTNALFSSDGLTFVEPLAATAPNYQFTIAAGDINITVL
jgi:hypothetical protein